MKLRLAIAALAAAPALGACTTTDGYDLFSAALSLYSDISYLNGDCPYGLHKWYDREGHHRCSLDDDHPSYNHRSDHGGRHRDGEDDSSDAE